jgi:hypothetical protein
MFNEIIENLKDLYIKDPRPWIVGFSGGKDSTMVASLVFSSVMSLPPDQRNKPVTVISTDTRAEIPAVVEILEDTQRRMQRFSQKMDLNIEVMLLKPPPEQSFWVNMIGRGYPPPNRTFRWCTQRMKIDPVNAFVNQRIGHWGEVLLHLGARRAESSLRRPWQVANNETDCVVTLICRVPGFQTPSNISQQKKYGHIYCKKITPGAMTTVLFISSTQMHLMVNVRYILIPAHLPVETHGLGAGRVLWWNETRQVKVFWRQVTREWKN